MNIEKILAECRAHWEKTKPDAVFADYWIGWQASRESLVIELPKIRDIEESMDCIDSAEFAVSECAAAIESAGMKVKS